MDILDVKLIWVIPLLLGGLSILSLVLSLVTFFRTIKVRRSLASLFSGKKASDLEGLIMGQIETIKHLDTEVQELFELTERIRKLALRSIHRVGLVRFNPFNDIGGDQSFAIALLDGKDSGLVISSIHTKEGTRVYSKPIIQGQATKYPLTEEEKQAIQLANSSKTVKN